MEMAATLRSDQLAVADDDPGLVTPEKIALAVEEIVRLAYSRAHRVRIVCAWWRLGREREGVTGVTAIWIWR